MTKAEGFSLSASLAAFSAAASIFLNLLCLGLKQAHKV